MQSVVKEDTGLYEGDYALPGSVLASVLCHGDSYDQFVEELVRMPKVAVEIAPRNRQFQAPNRFVLRVRVRDGHSKRLKVVAEKVADQLFLALVTEQGEILRQYHLQHSRHPNPDGAEVGRAHKHFPTTRYPLAKSHRAIKTWAYDPGQFPMDFVEAVKEFCSECNISVEQLQERMPLRWFR